MNARDELGTRRHILVLRLKRLTQVVCGMAVVRWPDMGAIGHWKVIGGPLLQLENIIRSVYHRYANRPPQACFSPNHC